MLVQGLGRSYGDCCLNGSGTLLLSKELDHMIAFNPDTGILDCEAGVSLDSVLKLIVPHAYFLPVSPGTKYVSVGGAIANDVHGKNHHVAGTFGKHVLGLKLLRSNGELLTCSADENQDLFAASIGGMGLTGLIVSAKIKLKKALPVIDQEIIKFNSLSELQEIENASQSRYEYTVSWIDTLASGKQFGRGLYFRGNHCEHIKKSPQDYLHSNPKLQVFFDAPSFVLSEFSIKLFNSVLFHKQRQEKKLETVPYDPFFYPLDAVKSWNRLYGKQGLYQYQFVVPCDSLDFMGDILKFLQKSHQASFLTVLKKFGSITSPGLMSFPKEGWTLALDFPNRGTATLKVLSDLDRMVSDLKGRLYSAKDGHMPASMYQSSYPKLEDFSKLVDPKFSSNFWRRVNASK
ncbi:MAG: FAD-binding oxidoreductase [Oligoflexales bacterium]|nr:FAD-binding oxidoreductase [Oligoflexales bacterium]